MNIPGVATVAAAVSGGVRMLQVGVSGAVTAAGVAQTVAGPVVRSVGDTSVRVLGGSPQSGPSVAWDTGRRLHLDLDPLLPFPHWVDGAVGLETVVRAMPGVRTAHVESGLGRLVVEHEGSADPTEIWQRMRAAAEIEAADIDVAAERKSQAVPFADPGDPLAMVMPLAAAGIDVVAVAAAITGRIGRLPLLPRTARAAAAVVNHQPRVVALLESHLGRLGADLVMSASTAATHGLSGSVGGPVLDLLQRGVQVSEALAHRRTWRRREPELASPLRPQAPIVPVISSAGKDLQTPRHGWTAAAVGELSHVAVDAAIDSAKGAVSGVVEQYANQAANGSLVAAAGTLLAGGGTEDAADAVLAGVPKAAHLGREGFAALLGRGLAKAGQLVLDPGALRRLDRIQVVVVDGAALRGDARAVSKAHGDLPGWDDDRVYEVADALLHGEQAPDPDADELPATGARLRWRRGQVSSAPAQGVEHADLVVAGQNVGHVEIVWEIDPFAVPLLQTANHTGTRVVLRHVAGTEELTASVAAAHPSGTPLVALVRELRADRGPVLLITALHPDVASTDTLAALAVADVAVALDDPRAATPWSADIITGPDLAAAVRILSVLPTARRVSESSVRLAQGGSTLAGLLLVTGETGANGRAGLRHVFSPVAAAGAAALASGAIAAGQVLRLPDPTPQPLTAWHALDPEIVYSRLGGGARPLAAEPGASPWRRRLADLSDNAALVPLRVPLRALQQLTAATRAELHDPLTPILAVGAAASAILGSNIDAILVGGVMTVNAFVGGVQRLRAENAAAALFAEQDQLAKRVVVPAMATIRRRLQSARHAERTVTVTATRLRPGDVIELTAPDVVPADARLLVADDLEVDESLLTGESLPVVKQVEPVLVDAGSDRASMVFEGSTIVAGHARAIVVATGAGTAAQRAISAVSDVGPSAGVQARLRQLTGKVLPLTLAGGAAVAGLALAHRAPLRRAVADGVAIAVAAVPEGLPLVATLAQLAAARRLSGRGVLVRTPRTLEALGRVQTVCFDKTGTLTENRLHVVAAVPAGANLEAPEPGLDTPRAGQVIRAAARACPRPHDGQGHAHATDEAILTVAGSAPTAPAQPWTALAAVPFESSRGYAAAVGVVGDDAGPLSRAPVLILKGAPERILPRCRFADGAVDRDHAESLVHRLAERGQRVIAVAQRSWDQTSAAAEDADAAVIDEAARDLELIGCLGLADVARPSARPLLEELAAAGQHVVLITGDHPVTAAAIARQLGLPCDGRVVTGAELAALDEQGRSELAAGTQVFARVSPEQKVQVICALRRGGRVTAMVGDGANDAAAIRIADVGIGVHGRGSFAARNAADLVLTREDLTALLDALVEGRHMWSSVRDALTILLGGNAGEVAFTILGTALGRGRAPVGTRQLLLVNLFTDMFPALAVAVTPQHPEPETDGEPAVSAYRHAVLTEPTPSLDRPLVQQILSRGAATAAGATAAWAIGNWTPGTRRRSATMGLTALVATQLAQTLLTRRHSPLVVATALGSAMTLAAIVQTPGISHFFGCTPLGPVAWTGVLAATATATVLSVVTPASLTKITGVAGDPGGKPA